MMLTIIFLVMLSMINFILKDRMILVSFRWGKIGFAVLKYYKRFIGEKRFISALMKRTLLQKYFTKIGDAPWSGGCALGYSAGGPRFEPRRLLFFAGHVRKCRSGKDRTKSEEIDSFRTQRPKEVDILFIYC